MLPQDGLSPEQSWGSTPDELPPYGQPFDPAVSTPRQQPPPPGWEQGTWTEHAGSAVADGGGRIWLIVGVAAVVLLAIVGVVAVMLA
jgi:hypothetical protein